MIGNTVSKEIFSKSRYSNFWSKSVVVFFVLLTTLGIHWKKKKILFKIPKCQRNVLTLNQTVGVICLVYTISVLCDYLLAFFPPSQLLFIMEELRVILVENIITRFLLPLLLILNTRRTLPALWAEKDWKRQEFFTTKLPSNQISLVQDIQEVPLLVQEFSVIQEGKRQLNKSIQNQRTTTTTLANSAMMISSLPEVSD